MNWLWDGLDDAMPQRFGLSHTSKKFQLFLGQVQVMDVLYKGDEYAVENDIEISSPAG